MLACFRVVHLDSCCQGVPPGDEVSLSEPVTDVQMPMVPGYARALRALRMRAFGALQGAGTSGLYDVACIVSPTLKLGVRRWGRVGRGVASAGVQRSSWDS